MSEYSFKPIAAAQLRVSMAPAAPSAAPQTAARPWTNLFRSLGSARWFGTALLLMAAGMTALSFSHPFWMFKLYAPQYPNSLSLVISLSGLSGDVREINMLNHYIGMAPLDQAAMFERRMASVAVSAIAAAICVLALVRGRWPAWLATALAAGLPFGFVADTLYWLQRFGHSLDPHAPLRIAAFTPQLFGNGAIGQFMTFALPQFGFWLAIASAVLAATSALLREFGGQACRA